MRYQVEIKGLSPLLTHNGAAGLDTRSPINQEKAAIAKKRGSNRTVSDDRRLRELECAAGLYLDDEGAATIPGSMLRSCIEKAARSRREGPLVRGGLVVESVDEFIYDNDALGTDIDTLAKNTQFTVPVVVQRARILRTRPRFKEWGVKFTVDVYEDIVDQNLLVDWLKIGGRTVGIGDWRPEKSGSFGRFKLVSVTELDEN